MPLVLSRQEGEVVELRTPDEVIEVTVLEIRRGKVKLSFKATQSVVIVRPDVAEKKEGGAT